jgi:hypothetical protein
MWQVHVTSLAMKRGLAETVSVAGPVSQPVAGPVSPPDTLAMKHGLVKTVPVAGPVNLATECGLAETVTVAGPYSGLSRLVLFLGTDHCLADIIPVADPTSDWSSSSAQSWGLQRKYLRQHHQST